MKGWQGVRLKRAIEQGLLVKHVECSDDSFLFIVQGLSDDYIVEINQHAALWPPTCNCEDNDWRPNILCKHIMLALALMGVEEQKLEDCCWEPEENELRGYLFHAPECVWCTLTPNHGISKGASCNSSVLGGGE